LNSYNGQEKLRLRLNTDIVKVENDSGKIKVSFDDGKTWPEKYWMELDAGRGAGYSCLTSIDENTIGILYEGSQAQMTFQKLAIDELINSNSNR
jgi:sialidase-1